MQSTDSLPDKHSRLAYQMLEDARTEIAAGDTVQGGEKLWGAASHAINAYCASLGTPHSRYAQRRQVVRDLADRLDNPSLWEHYGIALSCHANFYNDWLEQEDLAEYVSYIEGLVNIVPSHKAE